MLHFFWSWESDGSTILKARDYYELYDEAHSFGAPYLARWCQSNSNHVHYNRRVFDDKLSQQF